jgi:hypothetical protein
MSQIAHRPLFHVTYGWWEMNSAHLAQRNGEVKGAAFANFAVDPDVTAVRFHRKFAEREAKPG